YRDGTIYWAPGPGAHVLREPILGKYRELGEAGGVLSFPSSDDAPDGTGRRCTFLHGAIAQSDATGVHALRGTIATRWLELGGGTGDLGLPTTEQLQPPGKKTYQRFQRGRLVLDGSTVTEE